MRLAAQHADWTLGFLDETWWSRLAQPALHGWTAGESLRLIEQTLPKGDRDLKALACYGLLRTDTHKVWLRFVHGRLVSHMTTAFLAWLCERLAGERKRVAEGGNRPFHHALMSSALTRMWSIGAPLCLACPARASPEADDERSQWA